MKISFLNIKREYFTNMQLVNVTMENNINELSTLVMVALNK